MTDMVPGALAGGAASATGIAVAAWLLRWMPGTVARHDRELSAIKVTVEAVKDVPVQLAAMKASLDGLRADVQVLLKNQNGGRQP